MAVGNRVKWVLGSMGSKARLRASRSELLGLLGL